MCEEVLLWVARELRDCAARVEAKVREGQNGECFADVVYMDAVIAADNDRRAQA